MTNAPRKNVRFMQGNEACAEAAMLAGLEFYAGYPITPSTEIAEILALKLPACDGKFIQMEDEIASIAAIIGAALTGVKVMTATSGPGFSLMQENIGYAIMTEVPCVVVNVQRTGPSTGLPTFTAQADVMQARWGTHGDHVIPVLTASSVAEIIEMTIHAFNFAELLRTPVILLLDETIGHLKERVVFPSQQEVRIINRLKPTAPINAYQPFGCDEGPVPPLAAFGSKYRFNVTGLSHDKWGFPTLRSDEVTQLHERLLTKFDDFMDRILLYDTYFTDEPYDHLFVTYGCSWRSTMEAVDRLRTTGVKAAVLKLKTLWPSPAEAIRKYCAPAGDVIVVELNAGQYLLEVERILGPNRARLINRLDGRLLSPNDVVEQFKNRRQVKK